MAMTYEQIFAADPANPANIAQNAAITIFAPGDVTMTPLTITDPDGQPLANPIPVNANGFGSAFAHATLDRVAWAGGGFTGFFTSYEGMKNEAVAARTAAEAAASTAGADAVVRLDELIAAGSFEGPAGPLTNLTVGTVEATPGNPLTDEIVASEVTTGSLTTAALNATYASVHDHGINVQKGPYNAKGDGVTDDTAAIQAAINSVPNAASSVPGVQVFLPPGTYRITNTIEINRKALTLRGAGLGEPPTYVTNPGKGVRIKWDGPANIPMFHVTDVKNLTFSDLHIMGKDTSIPSEGIFFEKVAGETGGNNSNMRLERVIFGYWKGSGATDYKIKHHVRFGGINGDNDEWTFEDCEFWKATDTGLLIESTQSIWGNMTNCLFAADNAAATPMKGVVTSSSINGYRVSFDSCTIDVQVNSSAQVNLYGWFSERSKKCASVVNDRGRLFVYGGLLNTQDAEAPNGDGYYMESLSTSTGGGISLDGVKINYGGVGTRPKIKVRGIVGAAVGFFSIKNCNVVLTDLDVVAAASGSGIFMEIDDAGVFHRSTLNAGATLNPTSSLTNPTWTAYTPTLGTGWAIGNGTLDARYVMIGKTVHFAAFIQWGSTSTFGAGQLTVSLPATAAGIPAKYTSRAKGLKQGVGTYFLNSNYESTTTVGLYTTANPAGYVTATAPFTHAAADQVNVGGTYEAA